MANSKSQEDYMDTLLNPAYENEFESEVEESKPKRLKLDKLPSNSSIKPKTRMLNRHMTRSAAKKYKSLDDLVSNDYDERSRSPKPSRNDRRLKLVRDNKVVKSIDDVKELSSVKDDKVAKSTDGGKESTSVKDDEVKSTDNGEQKLTDVDQTVKPSNSQEIESTIKNQETTNNDPQSSIDNRKPESADNSKSKSTTKSLEEAKLTIGNQESETENNDPTSDNVEEEFKSSDVSHGSKLIYDSQTLETANEEIVADDLKTLANDNQETRTDDQVYKSHATETKTNSDHESTIQDTLSSTLTNKESNLSNDHQATESMISDDKFTELKMNSELSFELQEENQAKRLKLDEQRKSSNDKGMIKPSKNQDTKSIGKEKSSSLESESNVASQSSKQDDKTKDKNETRTKTYKLFKNLKVPRSILKGVKLVVKDDEMLNINESVYKHLQKEKRYDNTFIRVRSHSRYLAHLIYPISKIDQTSNRTQLIIASPTIDLMQQTYEFVKELVKYTDIQVRNTLYRDNFTESIKDHILCSTIESVRYIHYKAKLIHLGDIRFIVFDEFDISASSDAGRGKVKDVLLPISKRCEMIFISTAPEILGNPALEFAEDICKRRVDALDFLSITSHFKNILHFYIDNTSLTYKNSSISKHGQLIKLFKSSIYKKVVVMVSQKSTIGFLHDTLKKNGLNVYSLLSDQKVDNRVQTVQEFQSVEQAILIVHYPLNIGLEIKNCNMVINYDVRNIQNCVYREYFHSASHLLDDKKVGFIVNFLDNRSSKENLCKVKDMFKIKMRKLVIES